MKLQHAIALVFSLLLAACGGGSDDGSPAAAPPAETDTQSPTIALAADTLSLTSAGSVKLTASASDNVAVTAVEFYDGSARLAADAGNPNSATVALDAGDNGSHVFKAVARDAAGNSTTSATVTVTVAVPATPAAQPSQRQLKKSFTSLDGKLPVWYWEYLPADYATSTKTYPLLVFFHGAGETGAADGSQLDTVKRHGPPKLVAANNDMCFDTPAGRQCFIVVSPQDSRGWWNVNDTAGMLAHAIKTYRVDPKRIYVTGLSMGGGATWTLATASVAGSSPKAWWASQIAALVPIAGAADPKGANSGICNAMVANNLPVFAFHGTSDTTVLPALSQGWVDKLNKATTADGYTCANAVNPAAKLTLYPNVGHDSWTRTYDPATQVETGRNIYQWMLAHTR
jgi:predicted peptidase